MDKFVKEYKTRFRIFNTSEDEDIKKQLNDSYDDIQHHIGDFDPTTFSIGKELVFERTRYVRNESLEFFYDNFQQMIMDASIAVLERSDSDGN